MFVKLNNGIAERYVLSVERLRKEFPSVSFPKTVTEETLAALDIFPAVIGSVPEHNRRTHRFYTEETGTLIDGVWTLVQVVVERTPEEVEAYDASEAHQARARRDSWLTRSDWVVTKALETGTDIPIDWAIYRQALRDISNQDGFPHEITWPVAP